MSEAAVEKFVRDLKRKEASRFAGLAQAVFGPWGVRWCVSRVDKPERYTLMIGLLEPWRGSTEEDWANLGRISKAFGAPREPVGGMAALQGNPADVFTWTWTA